MSVKIGTNISSLSAQRRLSEGTAALSGTFQRLSSGLRINSASDDAAGLAIASSLKSDSRVFTQAIRNVNDGLSVLGIAQGALSQLSAISIRQRELAEQAANGSYSLQQRRSLNAEANALTREFNRITESVDFNGIKLLQKTAEGFRIQAGYGTNGSIAFDMSEELARLAGSGTFESEGSYTTSSSHNHEVVAGDLNGDGIMDIITAEVDPTGSILTVMIGNGDGTFRAGATYSGFNTPSSSVTLGDLNGDGILDVVTGAYIGPGNLMIVRLGTGNGTFGAAISHNIGVSAIQAVELADLNGDGINDVVTGGSSGLFVSFGNGNGTFKIAVSYAGTALSDMTLADFNGDGIPDAAGISSGNLLIRLGNGDGSFRGPVSYAMTGAQKIKTGDFNGDGVTDVVVSADSGFTIRLGTGDGTFGASYSYATHSGSGAGAITVCDLNGDGIEDIVTGRFFAVTDDIGYRFGNGDGTFGELRSYILQNGEAESITAADLNGDGVPDLITAGVYRVNTLISASQSVTSIPYLNINTRRGALEAMEVIDSALRRISAELGAIGSTQSRLGVALENLSVARENFDAAAGRIQDADMASESSDLIRANILQQTASAVLAQANQQPALVLKLLGNQ